MSSDSPDNDYDNALASWFGTAKPAPEDTLLSPKERAEQAEALVRVEGWVRERFGLAPDAVVSVSELACRLPGCPPLETVVTFWEGTARHHFKMFKRAHEVGFDDLPFAWLKDTLVLPEGFGCECC